MKLPIRPDLGLRALSAEWRALFTTKDLGADVVAGLTVACVAIPLSLAIALASGVPPAVGLVTAIVAGIVCGLLGGTPLQVSGPAAAMAVLIATIVQDRGLGVLLLVGVGCGVLQIATGALGLGRFVRLVPVSVIEGFTAGIGAIIVVGQLPRALGMPPPPQAHILDVITHIVDLAPRTNHAAVFVTLLTMAVFYGTQRISKRIPSHLVAVGVATLAVAMLNLGVATIGEIPRSLPMPHLPALPQKLDLGGLAMSTMMVFALASLETLLSASAVDKLVPGKNSDPDQELIGQGFGNLAVALFGGIPVTGVIARSATNAQAGAKTRRAAIFHALALLVAVLFAAPLIERIPIPALAGVLFIVAFRMLGPAPLVRLFRHSRMDGLVYIVTFVTIVFVDLLEGVQWGLAAALVIAAVRFGRGRMIVIPTRVGPNYVFKLEGPLTFLSTLDADALQRELDVLDEGRGVVFDVKGVTTLDASGAEMLAGIVAHARDRRLAPLVLGLAEAERPHFLSAGKDLEGMLVDNEHDAYDRAMLPGRESADARVRAGVARYRATLRPRYVKLFERLAAGQTPHTLFITCCDSRIDPNLITATAPGELFLVREIGNIVPKAMVADGSAIAAAIEYAVDVLRVKKIIVCGHSGCGAIEALLSEESFEHLKHIDRWLTVNAIRTRLRELPRSLSADEVSRMNVLAQLDHLQTYTIVEERLAQGGVSLSAWFFDVGRGEVEEWLPGEQRFAPLGEQAPDDAQGPGGTSGSTPADESVVVPIGPPSSYR